MANDDRSNLPALTPERALLTPTWVASLVVLVANDHWLKGSGLLPDVATGKLSDFAGMIVAPVLLAVLLRVRTRRGLLACHLAVAGVFSAIQLSPAFAGQWSSLMAAIGHPWAITCDPTDLLALPFLLLSWRLLVPEMEAEHSVRVPLQRTAVAALSVVGLWSTVATSEIDGGIDESNVWFEDVFGRVYINNANDFDISLFIRPLREDIHVDCDDVASEPERLLADAAFGEAEHWSLPPRTNVAIEMNTSRKCSAALVAGEGIPPQLIFVDNDVVVQQSFPGQTLDSVDLLPLNGMAIEFGEGGGTWIGGETWRYTPTDAAPEQPQSCEPIDGESRLDWSNVPANGLNARIEGLDLGPDGCFEFTMQRVEISDGVAVDIGNVEPWYLCAPEAAVPFAVGETVLVERSAALADAGVDVTELDPETLEVAADEQGRALRIARYMRGAADPGDIDTAVDQVLVAVPRASCPWLVAETCATVERGVDVAVLGGQSFFVPGEPEVFMDEGDPLTAKVRTAVLSYARERAVLDGNCSPGSMSPPYDIDLSVIIEPLN